MSSQVRTGDELQCEWNSVEINYLGTMAFL